MGTSLEMQAYERIKQAILTKELKPGERSLKMTGSIV